MPVRGRPLKQILLAAFFLASMAMARGQIIIYPNLGVYGVGYNRLDAINTLWLPTGCGAPVGSASLNAPGQKPRRSALYADTCGKHIYWYVPGDSTWQRIDTGGGGGSGTVTAVILSHDSLYYVTGSGNTFVSLIVTQADSTVLYVTPTQLTAALGTKLSAISTQFSVTGLGTPGSPVQLVGDVNAPGNSYYYGTNGSGAKGFYVIPAGVTSANPSQTISGSVVNGSATTFMRSDGAPAIASNAVTNTLLAQAPTNTIKGNNTGGTANEADLTVAQINAMLGLDTVLGHTTALATIYRLYKVADSLAGLSINLNVYRQGAPGDTAVSAVSGQLAIAAQRDSSGMGVHHTINPDFSWTWYGSVFGTSVQGMAPASGGGTTNYLRADGTWAAPSGGGGTPANPTAVVGLTAVNGSAATYMRSDAAPPIDQTISPTMSGAWIFSNTNTTFKNILPSATTTYSLGSTGVYWNNVYTNNLDVNNILPPSNLVIQLATGQHMETYINGVIKEELLATGQKQFNGYTSSSAFTSGTPTTLLAPDASGVLWPVALGTNLSFTGQTLNASGGGGASYNFYPNGQVGLSGPGDTLLLVDSAIRRNMGFPLWPDSTNTPQLAEWSGISDINDQLLGLTSADTVFKAICTQTNAGGYPHINYVESLTGAAGTYVMAPNDSIISGHYRARLFHNTSASFATVGYYISATNVAESQIDIYINTTTGCTIAGWPGSPTHAAVVTAAGLGVSFVYSSIIFINPSVTGTLYMMVDVQTTDGTYGDYLYSSVDGNAATWTLVQAFPVGLRGGRPWITKIGSTWYAWAHSVGTNSNVYSLPTDIYWFSSTNLTSWTSLGLAIPRITFAEGFNTSVGQLADIALVPRGGWVYFVATAVANGNSSGGAQFEPFSYQGTMQQLIATQQNNYPTAYIANNGGPDANFNSHLGIGIPLTNVPWAITVRENPSAGHVGTYSDPSLADVGNFSSSTYAPTFGFNHFKMSHPVGDYLMDSTQVGNWMNANNAGIGFSYAASGSHTATPITLAVMSYNNTYSRPEFNAYGNILYHANVDDGTTNFIQAAGAGVEFGPVTITAGGINGLYFATTAGTQNVASTTANLNISPIKVGSSSFTGTNILSLLNTQTTMTSASDGVLLGINGISLTSASHFLLAGALAGDAETNGQYFYIIGNNAFPSATGTGLVGMGQGTGFYTTTANDVTAVGHEAGYQGANGYHSVNGNYQTLLGAFAAASGTNMAIVGGNPMDGTQERLGVGTPFPSAWISPALGRATAGYAPFKFKIGSDFGILTTTGLTGTGASEGIQYAATSYIPFVVGDKVYVSGTTATSGNYNGIGTVTSCTTTQVNIAGSATGSQTVAGTVQAYTQLTTPEAGAMENWLDSAYYTGQSAARYNIAMSNRSNYFTAPQYFDNLTGPPSTYAALVHSTASDSGTYQVAMSSGTFTATITTVANCTSPTSGIGHYMQIGKQVTVDIPLSVSITVTSTATEYYVSLPVTSTISSGSDLTGQGTGVLPMTLGLGITGNTANHAADVTFTPTGTGSNNMYLHFTYTVD